MRRIEPGEEPACLDQSREDATRDGASINSEDWNLVYGDQKQALREASFHEQGGLCAYCTVSPRCVALKR